MSLRAEVLAKHEHVHDNYPPTPCLAYLVAEEAEKEISALRAEIERLQKEVG